ncbi:AbrB/MazE/SpoVT family DNA-binding domain-containing protein [Roseibacillus persicicus]|uniref:AbrB/MazE/SpoVT family DNA-binding domain-containing protein n=1 Tax=Roseibacillus persicicus TaxID=454148 RepID=UPI00398BB2BC
MSETVFIDKAGRLVVPKGVRDRLGLRAGDQLTMEVVGDRIELERATASCAVEIAEDGLPIIRGASKVDLVEELRKQRDERVGQILDFQSQ